MGQEETKRKILIVDDQTINIRFLGNVLKDAYTIMGAISGEDALRIIDSGNLPDLILLDIIMPGMNGHELCRHLKNKEQTRHIPIIFVTAMDEEQDEAMGLELGAVDYIAKPIHPAIIKARIQTQLELKRHRDELEELVRQRTNELDETRLVLQARKEAEQSQAAKIHSGRLAALGQMATAMAHEINQPLNVLSITVQGWQALKTRNRLTPEKMFKDVDVIHGGIQRISQLIDHVLVLGRNDGLISDIDLGDVVHKALSLCRRQFAYQNISLQVDMPEQIPPVTGDSSEIEQVVLNLLSNARHAVEQRLSYADFLPVVKIFLVIDEHTVKLVFEDNGGGVPADIAEAIFDPFYTTKPRGKGTGLGLSISSQIMMKFNGDLTLHNRPGQGATFVASLPRKSF